MPVARASRGEDWAMSEPLISVIIPTHNRPDFLVQALDSVLAQTFTDYEIIVVSNGEDKKTWLQTCAIAMDRGAKYFKLTRGNVCTARNYGMAKARGEWIALLDDDDAWLPHKLEHQVFTAEATGADMVVVDYIEFYDDGREILRQPRLIEGWSYTRGYSRQIFWSLPSGVLVRRDAIIEAGLFNPIMRYSEDNDLWRRISWHHQICQLNEVCLRYRQGHASIFGECRAARKEAWNAAIEQIAEGLELEIDNRAMRANRIRQLKDLMPTSLARSKM
jgi:glycosyltransferase involved in cell wall biosynthesis